MVAYQRPSPPTQRSLTVKRQHTGSALSPGTRPTPWLSVPPVLASLQESAHLLASSRGRQGLQVSELVTAEVALVAVSHRVTIRRMEYKWAINIETELVRWNLCCNLTDSDLAAGV